MGKDLFEDSTLFYAITKYANALIVSKKCAACKHRIWELCCHACQAAKLNENKIRKVSAFWAWCFVRYAVRNRHRRRFPKEPSLKTKFDAYADRPREVVRTPLLDSEDGWRLLQIAAVEFAGCFFLEWDQTDCLKETRANNINRYVGTTYVAVRLYKKVLMWIARVNFAAKAKELSLLCAPEHLRIWTQHRRSGRFRFGQISRSESPKRQPPVEPDRDRRLDWLGIQDSAKRRRTDAHEGAPERDEQVEERRLPEPERREVPSPVVPGAVHRPRLRVPQLRHPVLAHAQHQRHVPHRLPRGAQRRQGLRGEQRQHRGVPARLVEHRAPPVLRHHHRPPAPPRARAGATCSHARFHLHRHVTARG